MPSYLPNDLQEGAIGADIVLQALDQEGMPVDLSGATLTITIERPDGTSFTRAAVFDTDGTDGMFRIATLAGDLDQAGPGWHAQGRYLIGGTNIPTSVLTFEVLVNIP